MARLYSNENVPLELVGQMRSRGHDVLTSYEAGNANSRIPDDEVLQFAYATDRILLTNNRRNFIRLHRCGTEHSGIIVFTLTAGNTGIAERINADLLSTLTDRLLARIDGTRFTPDKY